MRDEISKIEKEKSVFSEKVDAFNQTKSGIEQGLSTEQEKFNNAEGQIKTSQKRLILIDKRLPDIVNELEKISQNQGTVDLELEEVKKSIQEIKGKQNNINKKIESNDSKIKSVLDHQSELASKKNVIDKKIETNDSETKSVLDSQSELAGKKNVVDKQKIAIL